MRTKHLLASWLMALSVLLVSGPVLAQTAAIDLPQRICANLASESQRVLDDSSATTKYLSPYIAAEIYQQVVSKSMAGDDVEAPAIAALPCVDTVSGFMMAIKKRMEYNRVDQFIVSNRVLVYGCLGLLLVGGLIYMRRQRQFTKKDAPEATS